MSSSRALLRLAVLSVAAILVLTGVSTLCVGLASQSQPPLTSRSSESVTPPPPTHPLPNPESQPIVVAPLGTEERVVDLLDPGAAFPRLPRRTDAILSQSTAPDAEDEAPADWRLSASARNVCSIPSARGNVTRLAALQGLADELVSAMDPAVDPCTNFYRFACGGWTAKFNETKIPKQQSSWSKSFSEIEKKNEKILREGESHATHATCCVWNPSCERLAADFLGALALPSPLQCSNVLP